MAFELHDIAATPNRLAPHYSRFRVSDRLLLTGHSHQAWPDVAFEGQVQAFHDAATHVDDKWGLAFAAAKEVRHGYRQLLGDPSGEYSLAASTHDLLVKLLSSLPWRSRTRLVATDSEFYSLERQLRRLEEEGIEVDRVAAHPAETVGERLAAAVNDQTAAVFTSTVFFTSAHIAGDLTPAAEACRRHGAILVLDAYHQLNVIPMSLQERDLEDAYVVGAGYKYCQLGEGNAFLRYPPDSPLRPVATGWFADFDGLSETYPTTGVAFPATGDRFAGGTYDPTGHYRASAVFSFFGQHALTPTFLRQVSQHQLGVLIRCFDNLDLDPAVVKRDRSVEIESVGGFLVLYSPLAGKIQRQLAIRGVATDARGHIIRLGPAPYLSDTQIEDAVRQLGDVAGEL